MQKSNIRESNQTMVKILYIEDDSSQRTLMAQALELYGYSVDVAESGMAGVDKAVTLKPDLILSDSSMPDISGAEAIKVLKTNEATAKIPILILSANADRRHKEQLLALGANEVFTKPINLLDLMPTLQSYVPEL